MTDKFKFDEAFGTFLAGVTRISDAHFARDLTNLTPPTFTVEKGSRYWRVVRCDSGGGAGRSVHCFIDTTNGDVLKAASWKAPARHARGNILDDKNGLGLMGEHGPAYLRY